MTDNSDLFNAGYIILAGALALGIVKKVFKEKPFKPKDRTFGKFKKN